MPNLVISQIKLRRGTESQRVQVILAEGELGYTTDTKRLYVGDGATLGGNIASNRNHTPEANYSSTYGQINDILYKNSLLYQLTAADYTNAANWGYIGPSVDTNTIQLSANKLALVQTGVIALCAISNSSSGLSVIPDNATIGINGSNQLYINAGGITSTQLAASSITNGKIDASALASGLMIAGGAVAINYDTASMQISSSALTLKESLTAGAVTILPFSNTRVNNFGVITSMTSNLCAYSTTKTPSAYFAASTTSGVVSSIAVVFDALFPNLSGYIRIFSTP